MRNAECGTWNSANTRPSRVCALAADECLVVPRSAFRVPRLLSVALTGNIAAGKSTVLDWFRRWGATVVDADELVREAQEPGTAVLTAIAKQFGTGVLAPDGSLD